MIKIKLIEDWGYYPKGATVLLKVDVANELIASGMGIEIDNDEPGLIAEARAKTKAAESDEEE